MSGHAHGAQLVTPEIFRNIINTQKALFTRALRTLDLAIDIHPMSFSPDIPSDQKGKGPDDTTAAKNTRWWMMGQMGWPMRIQVMKMVYKNPSADGYASEEVEVSLA